MISNLSLKIKIVLEAQGTNRRICYQKSKNQYLGKSKDLGNFTISGNNPDPHLDSSLGTIARKSQTNLPISTFPRIRFSYLFSSSLLLFFSSSSLLVLSLVSPFVRLFHLLLSLFVFSLCSSLFVVSVILPFFVSRFFHSSTHTFYRHGLDQIDVLYLFGKNPKKTKTKTTVWVPFFLFSFLFFLTTSKHIYLLSQQNNQQPTTSFLVVRRYLSIYFPRLEWAALSQCRHTSEAPLFHSSTLPLSPKLQDLVFIFFLIIISQYFTLTDYCFREVYICPTSSSSSSSFTFRSSLLKEKERTNERRTDGKEETKEGRKPKERNDGKKGRKKRKKKERTNEELSNNDEPLSLSQTVSCVSKSRRNHPPSCGTSLSGSLKLELHVANL